MDLRSKKTWLRTLGALAVLAGGLDAPEPVPVILDTDRLIILPTAVAAAGGEIKPEWKLDGVNLLPCLEGKSTPPPHAALYWRFGVQYAIRQGDWKLVKPHLNSAPHLFNLIQDPGERTDLASVDADKARTLQALWDAWNANNEPPRWIDNRWNGDGPAVRKAAARTKKRQP